MTGTARHPGRPPLKHPGCLALIAVVGIGIALVGWSLWRINAAVSDFQDRFSGPQWTLIEGPETLRDDPLEAQTFVFSGDTHLHGSAADVAILGGDAVLDGHYAGDVHFLGRNLDLAPGSVIDGQLRIAAARYVTIRGTARGGIVGTWDRIFPKDAAEPAEGTSRAGSP